MNLLDELEPYEKKPESKNNKQVSMNKTNSTKHT